MGVKVLRARRPPREFVKRYNASARLAATAGLPFAIVREMGYDAGSHPTSYIEHECEFATGRIAEYKPARILDIGSYRTFVLGLTAALRVTVLDVRPSRTISPNAVMAVGDAKQLSFPDGSFDAVLSLSSIEHFGLGRYGDEFDLQGDRKAVGEMMRVLKPGGVFIFSTTLTTGKPCLVFNLHRIYTREMLHEMCRPLQCASEAFFSHRLGRFCELSEVSTTLGKWDVYCGCWRKAP